MAFAGIAGAPLLWLTAVQAGYTLAYQACDSRSTSWVAVPTLIMLAAVAVTLGVTFVAQRRAKGRAEPQPFLVLLGTGIAALIVIVMVASAIPPFLLYPCD